MRLMTLKDWVYDYKVVFDHFFEIAQLGYNLGENAHEISIVTPRHLPQQKEVHKHKLVYVPPPLPADGVVSKAFVRKERREAILYRLATSGRLDLHAPVEWLLTQPSSEFNFYFSPSGRLQLRDTSTWPIAAIETWPSWLREDLFGPGIDIESAYTQFLIEHVREAYVGRESTMKLLFPDLLRSLEDKTQFRKELCSDVLGLEWNDTNVGVVKKICMSLANGSRISPGILLSGTGFSMTRDIILAEAEDTSATHLIHIGERLATISKQYVSARKLVCNLEMKMSPSRANQKKVFASYFEWERDARYQIWNAVGCHGIMVHDGIDGIPEEYLGDIPGLVKSLNLRLTRS